MKKTIQRLVVLALMLTTILGFSACSKAENDPYTQAESMRIISLSPSMTEVIYALGKGDALVGRSDFCNFPEQTGQLPSVGSLSDPNIEQILELEPDMVIASAHFKEDLAKKLEDLGTEIIVIHNAEDFKGSYDVIRQMGETINAKEAAEALTASLDKDIKAITDKVAAQEKPTVYYVVGFGKNGDYTATGDTFVAQIIEAAGGENIAKDATGWGYSLEKIIEADPEYIFISQNYGMKEEFELSEGYKQLSAVKNNKLISIDDDLLNRQGPRLAQGVESLAKILHPDLFN